MNPLITRLAHEASAPLEDMLARLIKTAALVVLAAGCAIAASVFLTMDLYFFIGSRWGTLIAAGSVAALYLFGALVFFLLAMRRPSQATPAEAAVAPNVNEPPKLPLQEPSKEFARAASVGAQAASAEVRNPAFPGNIDAAIGPVVNVLRAAGLDKEVVAIENGAAFAKQLNPLSLAAFAFGAGVLFWSTLRAQRLARARRPSRIVVEESAGSPAVPI